MWLIIKQVNPNGLHLLIFFFSFSERERHDETPNTPQKPQLTVSTETGAVLSHTVQMLGAAKSPVSESVLSDHILLYICFFVCLFRDV